MRVSSDEDEGHGNENSCACPPGIYFVAVKGTLVLPLLAAVAVRMSDCCLQGIQPCECKGEGHRWIGNQVLDD